MMTPSNRSTSNLGSPRVLVRLQSLPRQKQVLVVSSLTEEHSESKEFTTKQVADFYSDLRLPPVPNLSDALGRLRKDKLLVRPTPKTWALTPLGEERVAREIPDVTKDEVRTSMSQQDGATFGEHLHATIPPLLGPADTAPGLRAILSESPFEQNVMLITRFPKGPADHYVGLINAIREAVQAHGLRLLVASDGNTEDTLWDNVVTYMWASKYAIVLIDNLDGSFNSNVLIEIGGMLMTGRRCAILKDASVAAMPSDLVGHIYKPVSLDDHPATVRAIHEWVRDDLRLSACAECGGSDN